MNEFLYYIDDLLQQHVSSVKIRFLLELKQGFLLQKQKIISLQKLHLLINQERHKKKQANKYISIKQIISYWQYLKIGSIKFTHSFNLIIQKRVRLFIYFEKYIYLFTN
ncbi:hypothetical protein TTHERM_002653358 (macronuclear) [Tetrahymena thermophila SB210]|uniref:Uncharacterized protein n=1 Tax=Tetrahymena thermophila (strain SB210) TaxID=312017 RepID=W7XCP9_TETTS|nr:hypothetical protein TTHERM_002653358 [Tetrahymena thermophila SB210]EWS71566.1 hypothetical protein TTHERM_002653358 [Tetrahymena thermophila SB210]|eukprot:XP_012655900.1 hypothetical protein TTHERM_002653358 [Tetrahymena thermophila SB210]